MALAVAGVGAALYMNNLEQHKIDLTAMGAPLRERDTWVMYVRRPSSTAVEAPQQVDLVRT